jgi:transposase
VIVTDNASIHGTKEVNKILKYYNVSMVTIVPYAPWLNPSEKFINSIKENIKKIQK